MSLKAYRTTVARAESPRELEYRLFGDVTRSLINASKLAPDDIAGRIDALDWNRRLWSMLSTDCALPSNQLPIELRANIISLSLWVNRHSSSVMRGEEQFDPLIDLNRTIMQGLAPHSDAV
jgi:flagellar protein FlaF